MIVNQKNHQHTTKQWFSKKDAAEYLDVSERTVSRLIQRGLLTRSLGIRHVKISRASLERYESLTSTTTEGGSR